MTDSTPTALTLDEARHVAKLARLKLSEAELEACRHDLVAILGHVATLGELDLKGVEPMAHPGDRTNRIDPDEPEASMTTQEVLAIAPATEGPFIAVPKVLGGDEGSA
ncbi:MAG: Asp-tRNA(Asn)/Glu-tRNA(Gln) amidotransferase subunit GatC [Phycisphaerales bacterium]|nr:Asp-tRNA(Asn)/Glu-tRNA(Gln) amidotransferase subunit GatC [Phycisphaerales bacterium]